MVLRRSLLVWKRRCSRTLRKDGDEFKGQGGDLYINFCKSFHIFNVNHSMPPVHIMHLLLCFSCLQISPYPLSLEWLFNSGPLESFHTYPVLEPTSLFLRVCRCYGQLFVPTPAPISILLPLSSPPSLLTPLCRPVIGAHLPSSVWRSSNFQGPSLNSICANAQQRKNEEGRGG